MKYYRSRNLFPLLLSGILAWCFIYCDEPLQEHDMTAFNERFSSSPGNPDKSSEISDSLKFEQYLYVLGYVLNDFYITQSTYVVVNVVNVNTGEEKEICTTDHFLSGAIHKEFGLGSSKAERDSVRQILRKKRDRTFYFSSSSALRNISFDRYTTEELNEFRKTISIDKVRHSIYKNPFINTDLLDNYSSAQIDSLEKNHPMLTFENIVPYYGDEAWMFAHIMFNYGFPMGFSHCYNHGPIFDICRSIDEDLQAMKSSIPQHKRP